MNFESMLSEGKINSLGRTIEVVDIVLKDQAKFEELYQCYFSDDEWVRLRVSNAMKRVHEEHPEWFDEYIDKFLTEISKIDQPSTKWTFATLMLWHRKRLSDRQLQTAKDIIKRNLTKDDDWIVQNNSMEALHTFSKNDEALKKWLIPELTKRAKDERKSVARRAQKYFDDLS